MFAHFCKKIRNDNLKLPEILRDKTIADNLMYIPNYDT